MNPTRNLIVGLTAIVGLIGLAVTLLLVGELELKTEDGYPLTLELDNAQGITPGTPVTLNGVVVGAVERTTVNADPTRGVTVDLMVQEGINIPREGLEITTSLSLVGAATLDIQIPEDKRELALASGFIAPGESIPADAYTLVEQIGNVFDGRLQPFTDAANNVSETAQTFNKLGERLNGFVAPREGQDDPDLTTTLANLDAAIAGAREYLENDELRASIESAAAGASETFTQADAAITDVQAAADAFRTNIDELSKNGTTTMKNLDERPAEASDAFIESARELNATLADLRTTLANVNEGEGTVGQLMMNPDLYENINDASVRLEMMLLEATQFLRKYRTEGIDVQLF